MNSTGSGKSSTVSSVSELLDLYEEDPEEILFNLGFGREEPDLASRVPSRFINNASSARGIDIKVYLGAQLQRMELENPNYALTSRFRQIEVLTTVANEFFQLYSQVSGQPVQCFSSRDQGGEGGEGGGKESPPSLKRNNSARNVAKLLKKTISRHNLHAASSESTEAHTPNTQHTQMNGQTPSNHTNTNGHAHTAQEQDGCRTDPDHQVETVNQKHNRKKDSCSLATVTEETNGDGETDDSPEQSSTRPTANGEHQPESQRTDDGTQAVTEVQEEKNLTSTPEKAPPNLAPLQLAQLRTETTDSFDMEEIQSNEDESLPNRSSRTTDLLRTVSQQSDSSGFAEEPSADSNSYLKVQESSDSCDSETTVTSHPSQDVATPLAVDQPAFVLPDGTEEEAECNGASEADGSSSSRVEDEHYGSSEQVPQYSAHQLPRQPMETQQDEAKDEDHVDNEDRTESEPETEQGITCAAEQEPQPELEHTEKQLASKQEPQHSQNKTETATDTKTPTEELDAVDRAQGEHAFLDDSGSSCPSVPSSPVLSALERAKRHQLSRAGWQGDPQSVEESQIQGRGQGRGRGRGGIPLQRSSSLPSSLLSPSRVVSSVRIQFGRGQASCTEPRYSFRYTQESEGDKEEKEEGVDGQTNCLSTLIINPASSSDSINQPRHTREAVVPPKPIPRYLMRSSYSLQSSSPPPDWSPGGHAQSWSTQSVPDLSVSQQQPGQFQQNVNTNQNQQSWYPGQMMFPNANPAAQYLNPSPNPSPSLNPSPYLFSPSPSPQYPSPLQPYTSLPNLHHQHNPTLVHHSSLTSLHQPTTPTIPQHGSHLNLHQPSPSTDHHYTSLGNLQGVNPLYSHHSPYHTTPHSSQFASPYLGFHGYHMNPHLVFPHPVTQCPPLAPEHGLHPGLAPSATGFLPGLASTLCPGHGLHPGLTPPAPSSTEMQLRKVLHDIRGTVQSLSQTPDPFNEHRAALPSHQSLGEFQQKRRSLNMFRSQMMDLELSIIRQQALVYKHLSPADRLELEQLQSLRSAVREELQELEQQLEDKLMELTHHTQCRGLHSESSIDSLSTVSALRAMDPVSDLLREQHFLQSEISYDGQAASTNPSSRSSSPVRGEREEREQRGGTYRASINITPAPPPRPNTHTEEEVEEKDGDGDRGGGREGGGRELSDVEGAAAGGVRAENLQQLIREIRESIAQEVRREIYSELLATMSPRQSPLPARQRPL
ncbi:protein ITPRID2 isoform X3 [Sparus aurata]|nr:protein ITPRID2 isoform X3 [Sparus aurata]